jgi:hypothetical protein
VDVQNKSGTRVSQSAEFSADIQYRRIPTFIRAYFLTKKLDEFGQNLLQLGKLPGGANRQLSLWEVLQLLDDGRAAERTQFFGSRLMSLLEDARGTDNALDPEMQQVVESGLDEMNTYIECLAAVRGDYHRSFLVKSMDSLLLKNRQGALLAQARTTRAPRRFILDSRLLEVLLQLAVLRFRPEGGYQTEEIRVDELLAFIRGRYGLHIDQLPSGEGFSEPSIQDRAALRENREAFKSKLREIGLFQDLSDASITQRVTPRYRIGARRSVQSEEGVGS